MKVNDKNVFACVHACISVLRTIKICMLVTVLPWVSVYFAATKRSAFAESCRNLSTNEESRFGS